VLAAEQHAAGGAAGWVQLYPEECPGALPKGFYYLFEVEAQAGAIRSNPAFGFTSLKWKARPFFGRAFAFSASTFGQKRR
jgi:hypothetical protein